MHCEYQFDIIGALRLEQSHPIALNGRSYRFLVDAQTSRVTSLVVTVRSNDRSEWPEIIDLPQNAANPRAPKFELVMRTPQFQDVMDDVRTIEGMLSLHGLDRIDTDQPQIRFIPEREEEQHQIVINNFKLGTQERPITASPLTPFDLVARSVLAAGELRPLQVALSFFRKGRLDMHSSRYIDAFYDYFFVLESLFGQGKSRTQAMLEAFKESTILMTSVRDTMNDAELRRQIRHRGAAFETRLNERYIHADPGLCLANWSRTSMAARASLRWWALSRNRGRCVSRKRQWRCLTNFSTSCSRCVVRRGNTWVSGHRSAAGNAVVSHVSRRCGC